MKSPSRILVLFGTTDGQTEKVARALASEFQDLGCFADVVDGRAALRTVRASHYAAVVVAASVHAGGYQRSVQQWVRANSTDLARHPSAFVSVCLGILEHRDEAQRELGKIVSRFLDGTAWHPGTIQLVAGAIPYTRYGWLKKRIMKHIARKTSGGTDTSRDYEYTDWNELRAFAEEFVRAHGLVPRPSGENVPVPEYAFHGRPEI